MTLFLKCCRTALLCSLCWLMGFPSYGQTLPDSLSLPEVTVEATRIHQPLQLQPTKVDVIDSTQLKLQSSKDLGELLNASSTLFIKDNGPGGLATASQHGLSAEQVQVLWEGIPINSVMLGLSDLSLLPASFFSGVQISSGTPSTAFGGGSLAGAIYLDSKFSGSDALSFRQGVGSYGQWQSALNGQYHAGSWHVNLKSAVSRADNDFSYYNDVYDKHEEREHNRQEQTDVLAGVGYQAGVKDFETKIWISNSQNQIPGSILKSNSRARQDDRAVRWLSSYKTRWHGAHITLKNYLDRVELNYFDPDIDTRSLSTFRRWLTSAGMEDRLSNQVLMKAELSGGLSGVETNNYNGLKTRRRFSTLINPELAFFKHKFLVYPALRLDSYSDFGTVISPSLGLNYELVYDKLYARGQLSRDFNPPTFNNLYFQPNNDPSLHAERSNRAEAGLIYNPRRATFSTLQISGFWYKVDDGIRYFSDPDKGGRFFPENVNQITSKGLEASLKNKLQLAGHWQLGLNQSVRLTDAEISEPRFTSDAAVGDQLRYVPKWNYHATLQLNNGMFTGLLQYRWTSRRYYTDTEEYRSSLDPYSLLNATLQVQQSFFGLRFTARGGVRNLLDTNYQIIRFYALPQRNYHFSLTATYQF